VVLPDGGLAILPAPATSLPPLHVEGNTIQDSAGSTVVLRGVCIPDIGLLDSQSTDSGVSGVRARIDEVLTTAQLDAHVIRLPVYPRTVFNGGSPTYSPEPFPVGQAAPSTSKVTVTNLSVGDYVSQVLQPAVDYATSKGLYAIVDFHQIDNATGDGGAASQSGQDAITFWTQIAPVFSNYPNVFYEAFNEPIDTSAGSSAGWNQAYLAVAQSWVNTIRAGAPNNIIVVGSPSWSQYPNGGHALTGSNLVFTAHAYPNNWPGTGESSFLARVQEAAATAPVFFTEWGFQIGTASKTNSLATPDDSWGQALQSVLNAGGESWTAWVADPSWGPPMFADASGTLTDFGTFVQTWLAADVDAGWIQ
jgi:hypothetical protein